jgi:polyisoprenoid-binding protein YceI
MTADVWYFDVSDGQLLVHTRVTGRAAKMGHRLTIAMNAWKGSVEWAEGEPAEVQLTVEVDSLQVLRGEGGVTPLSGREKALARSDALKALGADRSRRSVFRQARSKRRAKATASLARSRSTATLVNESSSWMSTIVATVGCCHAKPTSGNPSLGSSRTRC